MFPFSETVATVQKITEMYIFSEVGVGGRVKTTLKIQVSSQPPRILLVVDRPLVATRALADKYLTAKIFSFVGFS